MKADYAVDLYWLPLGAGGHSVRLNGRVYEAALAEIGKQGAGLRWEQRLDQGSRGRRSADNCGRWAGNLRPDSECALRDHTDTHSRGATVVG